MAPAIIRSMLSLPGNRARFLEKARTIPADAICFDLEDSVTPDDKAAARDLVAAALPRFDAQGRLLVVRINSLDTGLAEHDLEAVVGPNLHAINLPKCHSPDILRQVDAYLTFLERSRDLPPGHTKLIPWVESAQAVAQAYEICTASPRLLAVCLGAEDYALSLGLPRTPAGAEIQFPRALLANAAAAAGLLSIDTPLLDYTDAEGFQRDAYQARALGYRGKFCIHPSQVEPANRLFAPSADELAWARRVLAAYEEGGRNGRGAVALDGAMIDDPIADRARATLTWQEQVEARNALLGVPA